MGPGVRVDAAKTRDIAEELEDDRAGASSATETAKLS